MRRTAFTPSLASVVCSFLLFQWAGKPPPCFSVAIDFRLLIFGYEFSSKLRIHSYNSVAHKYDNIARVKALGRRYAQYVTPFFDYPPEIRKVIYINAIESINMSLRKVINTRSSFSTDGAVSKLLYLALNHICKKWTMPLQDWKGAINRFAIQFDERIWLT